jgi:hypothetical protein
MKQILFFLSTLIYINTSAQHEYIYQLATGNDELFVDVLENPDLSVYVLGWQRYYVSNELIPKSIIQHLDNDGNLLSSIDLTNYSEKAYLIKIIKFDSNIYAFGSSKSTKGVDNIIIKYDMQFNEVERKHLFLDTNLADRYVTALKMVDSCFYIISVDTYISPIFKNTFSILKVNNSLDSVASFSALPYSGAAYDAIDDKNGGIKVFTYLYKLPGYGQVAHYDKNLNELSVDTLPDLLHFNNNSMWLTDSTFLVTGTTEYIRDSIYVPYYYDWDMGIIVLDTNNNQLDYSIQIRRHGDENPGWSQNIVRSKTNGYYFVGTQNQAGFSDTSKIILTMLDSSFNMIWEKTIWDGFSSFEAAGLYLLQDTSLILLVRKYESQNNYFCDALVYRISKNGSILSITNIGKQIVGRLNVFPNPASEFINITLNKDVDKIVDYKIYDIQGKLVEANKSFTSKVRVDISRFSSGNYFVLANTLKGGRLSAKFIVNKN